MRKEMKGKEVNTHGLSAENTQSLILAIFSTSIWLIWFFYCFESISSLLNNIPYLHWNWNDQIKITAMIIMQLGVLLAIWTRISRNIWSPAWGLYDEMPLITVGPYKYIRHPSYVFYFILFITLPIITGLTIAWINMMGIVYYVNHVKYEEQLLIKHYGNEYIEYQNKVGKFIPKLF